MTMYADDLSNFMSTFETLLEEASKTCKRSAFGFTASAARVRQRPDRRALRTAHLQIREIYHDAVGHACAERQHLFAAATLRLQIILRLLL
jgi:hypothetical protein